VTITIINGPNLNLLGTREPDLYGTTTFENYFEQLRSKFPMHDLKYFQSNLEGELINAVHQAMIDSQAIILNAAGYTHTSVSIGDAVKACGIPVVEVHITNVFSRESYRHQSFIAPHASGTITGFGLSGYELAIASLNLT
jgi:3-dehydroquinate dehydratase II